MPGEAIKEMEILEFVVEVWMKDSTGATDDGVKAQVAEMYIEAEKFIEGLQTKYPNLKFILA